MGKGPSRFNLVSERPVEKGAPVTVQTRGRTVNLSVEQPGQALLTEQSAPALQGEHNLSFPTIPSFISYLSSFSNTYKGLR